MRYNIIVAGGLQLPPPADRVGVIATAAIEQTGRYYKQKDDSANPFKLNDQELFKYAAAAHAIATLAACEAPDASQHK